MPDAEFLQFDDVIYGLDDFPGDGDAKSSSMEGSTVNGIILREDNGEIITIENNGEHGLASINQVDGTFEFTPTDSDFRGTDNFSLRIQDANTGLIRIQHVDLVYNNDNSRTEEVLLSYSVEGNIHSHFMIPNAISLKDGGYLLAYVIMEYDSITGGNVQKYSAQKFDESGNKIGNEIFLQSIDNQIKPQISELSNGDIVLMYRQNDIDYMKMALLNKHSIIWEVKLLYSFSP